MRLSENVLPSERVRLLETIIPSERVRLLETIIPSERVRLLETIIPWESETIRDCVTFRESETIRDCVTFRESEPLLMKLVLSVDIAEPAVNVTLGWCVDCECTEISRQSKSARSCHKLLFAFATSTNALSSTSLYSKICKEKQ